MRFGLFGKGLADKARVFAEAGRIKAQVRDILGLPEAAAIAVNEILCADPACPGNETVILVMSPGEKTLAYKAQMDMAAVTRAVLEEVLGTTASSRTSGEAAPTRDPS